MKSTTVRLTAIIKSMDMDVAYTLMVLITKENGMMINLVEKAVRCMSIMKYTLETLLTISVTVLAHISHKIKFTRALSKRVKSTGSAV